MTELTVIMPVYNGERFIAESIDSVLTQTFQDFELLILNDNSKDNTLKILQSYQQKDSRIRVINKLENIGPANLRNEAITLAKTEYIALLDADDIAMPTRFEKQMHFLKNNPDYGVCGSWFTFFGDKKHKTVKHQETHKGLKVQMLKNCCIGNPTVMFKKSHLGELRFENKYVPAEDYALWSQLIAKTKFYNIQESLLNYRWHPNNISQTKVENLKKSEVVIKKKQLVNFGIAFDNTDINYYLNAVNLTKGLSKNVILKTIKASNKIKEINYKSQFYDKSILSKHIDKVIIRTIRNSKEYDKSFFKTIKNESGYFSKIPILDKVVFYVKCQF